MAWLCRFLVVLVNVPIAACTVVRSPSTIEQVDDDGESSSSTAVSTSAAETSSTSDGGDTTGGSPIEAVCHDLCEHELACDGSVDRYLCEIECGYSFVMGTDLVGCVDARIDLLACVVGLTCADLDAYLADPEHGPCGTQGGAVATACDGTCEMAGSTNNATDGTCSVTFACGLSNKTIACTPDGCDCKLDDMVVHSCANDFDCSVGGPPDGTMMIPLQWTDVAATCCGWDDVADATTG